MAKRSVFISHSTNKLDEKDRSVIIRDLLYSTLSPEELPPQEKKWDVFIDIHNVEPGANWRMDILHGLAETQSGVILFNEKAIHHSPWVADEALILCFRKSIDPDFEVIPVLFDGKHIDDTCFAKYEPFQLNAIQVICDKESIPPEKIVNDIFSRLDKFVKKQPPVSPWVKKVVSLLKDVEISVLEDAADEIKLSYKGKMWNKSESRRCECLCRSIVELIHHRPITINSVLVFRKLILGFRRHEIEDVYELAECLTAKWVSNEAIEIILCASRNPKIGILTIDAKEQEVIDRYIYRSQIELLNNPGSVWIVLTSSGAGPEDDLIIGQIEQDIRTTIMRGEGNIQNLPEDIDKKIIKCNGVNDVAICVLPPDYAKERILKRLRDRYPKIIFLARICISDSPYIFGPIVGKALPLPKLGEGELGLVDFADRLDVAIDQVFPKKARR